MLIMRINIVYLNKHTNTKQQLWLFSNTMVQYKSTANRAITYR